MVHIQREPYQPTHTHMHTHKHQGWPLGIELWLEIFSEENHFSHSAQHFWVAHSSFYRVDVLKDFHLQWCCVHWWNHCSSLLQADMLMILCWCWLSDISGDTTSQQTLCPCFLNIFLPQLSYWFLNIRCKCCMPEYFSWNEATTQFLLCKFFLLVLVFCNDLCVKQFLWLWLATTLIYRYKDKYLVYN